MLSCTYFPFFSTFLQALWASKLSLATLTRASGNLISSEIPSLNPSFQASHPAGKDNFAMVSQVDPISHRQMLILK